MNDYRIEQTNPPIILPFLQPCVFAFNLQPFLLGFFLPTLLLSLQQKGRFVLMYVRLGKDLFTDSPCFQFWEPRSSLLFEQFLLCWWLLGYLQCLGHIRRLLFLFVCFLIRPGEGGDWDCTNLPLLSPCLYCLPLAVQQSIELHTPPLML